MEEWSLLRAQRNDIFLELQQADFNPADFHWDTDSELREQGYVVLVHSSSRFVFIVRRSGDFFEGAFAPGREFQSEEFHTTGWNNLLYYVRLWLNSLRREVVEVDLWEAFSKQTQLINSASELDGENTPFTSDEQERIAVSLNEIKQHLFTTQDLTEEQITILENRLTYLEQAATRLGRNDWINIAVGVLTNIIVAAAFAPGTAQEVLRVAGTVLSWVLRHSPTLLQ